MAKPNKFSGMMHDYCALKGWCGSVIDGKATHVTDYIPERGQVSAEQFVTWLLMAEGVNPYNLREYKYLIKVFVKHMGSTEVDASKLK